MSLEEVAALRSNVTTASRTTARKRAPGYRFARRGRPSFLLGIGARGSREPTGGTSERRAISPEPVKISATRIAGESTRAYPRVYTTRTCVRVYVYRYIRVWVYMRVHLSAMCVCVCVCTYARACINFSRSQNAHARGHGRHASALGETLRPDPRSFLSPRFSVPCHPHVAQARTAFRISEGRATRTREGATARGSVAAGVGEHRRTRR